MATATNELITWSDRYSVGIANIDREHQKLVAMVNQLYTAILSGEAPAVASKVLDGLAGYTMSHFANEEALMKRYNYPGYAQHKAEHDKLVDQVRQFQSDLRAGKAKLSQDLMSFLQGWLIGHILGVDKKYTIHLHGAGVK